MNLKLSPKRVLALAGFFIVTAAHAETAPAPTWHAQTLTEAIINMLLFAAIGIAAAIIGFKMFDKCTPGDLAREIVENKNIAAAILSAAVVLGVCLIIAAAMIG
jgi:putative membrane protein